MRRGRNSHRGSGAYATYLMAKLLMAFGTLVLVAHALLSR